MHAASRCIGCARGAPRSQRRASRARSSRPRRRRRACSSGFEILLDAPGVDLSDPRLGLGGSTARLVEFARMGLPPAAGKEFLRLRMGGLVPVIAHPERYWGCTADLVDAWRSVGRRHPDGRDGDSRSEADAPLRRGACSRRGLVDLFASDTHVDKRSLAAARQWLTEVADVGRGELADARQSASSSRRSGCHAGAADQAPAGNDSPASRAGSRTGVTFFRLDPACLIHRAPTPARCRSTSRRA